MYKKTSVENLKTPCSVRKKLHCKILEGLLNNPGVQGLNSRMQIRNPSLDVYRPDVGSSKKV